MVLRGDPTGPAWRRKLGTSTTRGEFAMGDTKIETVQGIYEAFGNGDVQAILAVLTDEVDFGSEPDSTIAPWHGRRRNKQEVTEFFQSLAENLEVTEFTPLSFTSSDTDVMAVIRFGVRVPATGKSGTMHLHHWWRFDGDKVCFYRGTEDTALTAELLRP
jgi:ketosteroid isomerase-like protein